MRNLWENAAGNEKFQRPKKVFTPHFKIQKSLYPAPAPFSNPKKSLYPLPPDFSQKKILRAMLRYFPISSNI